MAEAAAKQGTYVSGVGRRKSAVALVRLSAGKGHHTANGKPFADHFTLESWRTRSGSASRGPWSRRTRRSGPP